MKKIVLKSLIIATLAAVSTTLLAQDDSEAVPLEENRQQRIEALRELSKEEREERRSAARDHFESLSEAEQAQVREQRQQRQQARRAEDRSLRRRGAEASADEPDSSQ